MSYLLTGGGGKRCYCFFGASRRWGFIICKKVACPSSLQKNDYFTRALRSRHCNSTLNFRAQVAMYARFEAAQQISESVGGNAQHEWLISLPLSAQSRQQSLLGSSQIGWTYVRLVCTYYVLKNSTLRCKTA